MDSIVSSFAACAWLSLRELCLPPPPPPAATAARTAAISSPESGSLSLPLPSAVPSASSIALCALLWGHSAGGSHCVGCTSCASVQW